LTRSEFPLDLNFRGNEVQLWDYLKRSRHENFVFASQKRFKEINSRLFRRNVLSFDPSAYDALIVHDFDRSLFRRILESGYSGPVFFYLHCLAELYSFSSGKESHNYNVGLVNEMIAHQGLRMIAVSQAAKRSFLGVFPGAEVEVLHGSADPALYFPSEEKVRPVDARFVFGYSGRPDRVKGADTFISVLRRFEEDGPDDVGFYLALSGSMAKRYDFIERVSEAAPSLVSSERIKFCVDLSKKDVDGELALNVEHELYTRMIGQDVFDHSSFSGFTYVPLQRQVDAYFHPANTEAFGLSILEAVMSGIPVVASDVGGIGEIVSSGQGELVPLSDETRLGFMSYSRPSVGASDVERFYGALVRISDGGHDPVKISSSVSHMNVDEYARSLDSFLEKHF
jgi:glycosyltransferase involved in cell wall biosynthesis